MSFETMLLFEELIPLLLPLSIFALSATITPGPNTLLLATSGANFGIRNSLPHIVGIRIGFTLMQILMAFGLGALFVAVPALHHILKIVGCGYLLWLALKIARMQPPQTNHTNHQPFTWQQALLFQFVNPKAWIVISSGMAAFTLSGSHFVPSALLSIVIFNLVGTFSALVWICFGAAIGQQLTSDRAWQRFNLLMALVTASSIGLIIT